jgi:hypothetical protein
MSYSRVLTLGGETFGELIALRMEMSPIAARHDKKRQFPKGGCNESTRTLAISIDLKSNIQVSVSAGSKVRTRGSAMARPVYLLQRTYLVTAGTAVECHKRTRAPLVWARAESVSYLISRAFPSF